MLSGRTSREAPSLTPSGISSVLHIVILFKLSSLRVWAEMADTLYWSIFIIWKEWKWLNSLRSCQNVYFWPLCWYCIELLCVPGFVLLLSVDIWVCWHSSSVVSISLHSWEARTFLYTISTQVLHTFGQYKHELSFSFSHFFSQILAHKLRYQVKTVVSILWLNRLKTIQEIKTPGILL